MISTYTTRATKKGNWAIDNLEEAALTPVEQYVLLKLLKNKGLMALGLKSMMYPDYEIRDALETLHDNKYIVILMQTDHPEPKDLQYVGRVMHDTFIEAIRGTEIHESYDKARKTNRDFTPRRLDFGKPRTASPGNGS